MIKGASPLHLTTYIHVNGKCATKSDSDSNSDNEKEGRG